MKAVRVSKELIQVYINSDIYGIYVTDIYNVSYCLARFVVVESNFYNSLDDFLNILKQQKSIRAVIQKFNAICKALEL